MHLRAKKRWTATVTAVAVAALAGITAFVALPSAAAASGDSAINGFRNVAYFTQWGVYGRGYQVKDVDTSGVAAQLTHINYAFANIHYQTLECFEANKAQGTGPPARMARATRGPTTARLLGGGERLRRRRHVGPAARRQLQPAQAAQGQVPAT